MTTKELITKNALKLFRKKGYDNVTVQDICEECNITKPTFYNHIPAKEDLILYVYDDIIGNLMNETYKLIMIENSYEQFVYIFVKLYDGTIQLNSDLLSQIFIANFKKNRESFALREPLTQLAITTLKKAQEKGEIQNHSEAECLYRAIAHMFTGYTNMWCVNQGKSNFSEEFFRNIESVLMVKEELRECYRKYLQIS